MPPKRSGFKSVVSHDLPEMISDGRRMRVVWRPGDGDGDATRHVFERTKSTLRGHPTWKVFTGDIPTPFTRGSKEEPPHYVYLDDAACYIIYKSGLYTDEELREFWPFDFDHQGNVKTGRYNRGRPAWVDGDVPEIARGRVRGKKRYDFTGQPETSEYKPLRPPSVTKAEREVHAEWAARKNGSARTANATQETHSTPTGSNTASEIALEDNLSTHNDVQPKSPRTERLDKVAALRSSPPRYPPPPVPKQSQTLGHPTPLPSARQTLANLKPWVNSISSPVSTPKRKRGPFLDSSSSGTESSPASKSARLDDRDGSHPKIRTGLPPDCQGGEHQSSSLPFELPEASPDVGSDGSSGDDEFLKNVGKVFGKRT